MLTRQKTQTLVLSDLMQLAWNFSAPPSPGDDAAGPGRLELDDALQPLVESWEHDLGCLERAFETGTAFRTALQAVTAEIFAVRLLVDVLQMRENVLHPRRRARGRWTGDASAALFERLSHRWLKLVTRASAAHSDETAPAWVLHSRLERWTQILTDQLLESAAAGGDFGPPERETDEERRLARSLYAHSFQKAFGPDKFPSHPLGEAFRPLHQLFEPVAAGPALESSNSPRRVRPGVEAAAPGSLLTRCLMKIAARSQAHQFSPSHLPDS